MDLSLNKEDLAFRDEVREFLNGSLPDDLRGKMDYSREEIQRWHKIVYEKGWIAPAWPKEYGGTGWTLTQRHIYSQELSEIASPALLPFGLSMVGPVIYTFGTQEQKEQHIPGILSGDVFWCQGYSEPGSGSDLASLKTRAERDGDEYVVNGQKIWTSAAHMADWIFCLVRTNTEGKPQTGISFLLIDMNTPGITVKPIISIDNQHHLNEVFFDNVRVPVANRIGEENKGWTYAKFLLGHERTGIAGVSRSKKSLGALKALAKLQTENGETLYDDPGFRRRLTQVDADLRALEITDLRSLAHMAAGNPPGPESSVLKIKGTEIQQTIGEMSVEAYGHFFNAYDLDTVENPVGPETMLGDVASFLYLRAATIYGGSNEIQRNVIAKNVLGLEG